MNSEKFNYFEGTTFRAGRERDLETYEDHLGFKRKDLEGKRVLELGSGEREIFSKELKESVKDVDIVLLNPDYLNKEYRENISKQSNIRIAAIGQSLPFKDEAFDIILGLYSLTVFSAPYQNKEGASAWAKEILRVLKSGGKAILGPAGGGKDNEDAVESTKKEYEYIIKQLKEEKANVIIESYQPFSSKFIYNSRIVIEKPL